MNGSEQLANFLMIGRSAQRDVQTLPGTVPKSPLMISDKFNVSEVLPDESRDALAAAETFKLFFVFENYLRDFILGVLSEADKENWWNSVPQDVRDEVTKLEETEEQKKWMNLDGARGRLSLTTLPQLIRIMDEKENWKKYFEAPVGDKGLLQQTRLVVHTRNTVCHMSTVTAEEHERLKQVMRDWFRVVAP
jgi:Swt1-like HEPN